MIYFFRRDSVCIDGHYYETMRPDHGREFVNSDEADAGRSQDNDNMVNVVCPDYIHTI